MVPDATLPARTSARLAAPALRRRLAVMVYEGVILFGVVFIAGYLFSTLTQQRNGLTHHNELMAWIGFVLAVYFVWCWTHGGQTLPMKTWQMKVVDTHGQPVKTGRAILRHVLAWLWFLPPLALHPLFGLAIPQTLIVFAVWIVLWAAAVRLDPARQFLHDRFAGTRIVVATPH
jgi:uncharacterized RDD family membrane protein YckC